MNRMAKAPEKIEKLEPRIEAARAELHAAIKDAHAEGAGLATIARVPATRASGCGGSSRGSRSTSGGTKPPGTGD